jgi:septum formation protein
MGIVPDAICPTDIDETRRKDESPRALAERLAREKALACPEAGYVLASDTVVALGQRNLEKAADAAEAEAFLRLLSGRAHQCITGIAVKAPDGRLSARTVLARVKFKRLTDQEIAAYVASGDWKGKAGGYGIQGSAGAFVTAINGSYTAIVGLPLYETKALLEGMGWKNASL